MLALWSRLIYQLIDPWVKMLRVEKGLDSGQGV